ncbi:Leucine-rich repeat-containing protein 71 [Blyttiomyces sp. JEL0837]|nr:Leucine-rich repeat-containing protein 71 [Blyttiomyces sp. JEL0837]
MEEIERDSFLTGVFEPDYLETCKRLAISDPPFLLKVQLPLPPLPLSLLRNSNSITSAGGNATGKDDLGGSTNFLGINQGGEDRLKGGSKEALLPSVVIGGSPSEGPKDAAGNKVGTARSLVDGRGGSAYDLSMRYKSRFRFKPTIYIESAEADDEDDICKLEVRGWKMPLKVMEVLTSVLPGCSSVSNLVFWNCGLEESHFSLLLSTILSSNVKSLSVDQNPGIPQHLFAYLVTDDSSLKHLSLRMNNITDAGAKALAGALKTNRGLISLNLWDNRIGKEGAADFAEVLSNYALTHDELVSRRKMLADLEKQRREQEEDPIVKKAKGRINTGHGRNSSASAKKSEETLIKKEPPPDAKSAKKAPAKPPGKKEPPPSQKKTPEVANAPSTAPAGKKGPPATASSLAPPDDKKQGKDKKGANAVKGKKGKVEETREEVEESTDVTSNMEPMFEHNGQWFVLGNRTLNSINLSQNGISEDGLKSFLDAVTEQEKSAENVTDGTDNSFEKDSTVYTQLMAILCARNPYYDHIDQESTGEKSGERKDDEESEDGTSVLEEEAG